MAKEATYKAKLNYTVRSTQAPGELSPSIVPVIVERLDATSLATVVANCIDRGLIAGLKPTAAEGIADGIARQLAREFELGRGVKFGQYFYGRPYLSGTCGPNGRLTSENSINVRLYKGEAFKLKTEDFQLTFDGAADAVKVDYIFGDTSDGGNNRGRVVVGSGIIIQGSNLYGAGDTNRVTFTEVGAESTPVVVSAFTNQGAGILTFPWPAGLAAGKTYNVMVERTDTNGTTRVSTGKTVEVVASSIPAPMLTAINGGASGETVDSSGITLGGMNLTGASVKFSFENSQGQQVERSVTPESVESTEIVLPSSWDSGVSIPDGSDVTFTVTTGGGSAQILGSYHA